MSVETATAPDIAIPVNTNDGETFENLNIAETNGLDEDEKNDNPSHIETMHSFEGIKSWWFAIDAIITSIRMILCIFWFILQFCNFSQFQSFFQFSLIFEFFEFCTFSRFFKNFQNFQFFKEI
jgi:hypothetical protein